MNYVIVTNENVEEKISERHCSCGECDGHDKVILHITKVIPEFIDFESKVLIPGCCGSCAILDAVEDSLSNDLVVSEDIKDLECFPEIPLENATYIFNMSITGKPDHFTGCFDVETEYSDITVLK